MAHYDPVPVSLSDGSEAVIRSLRPEDAGPWLAFRLALGEESQHTLAYPGMTLPPEEKFRAFLEECARDPQSIQLGAFTGDHLVGHCAARPVVPGHPWAGHVAEFGMAVRRSHWGRGLGKHLLAALDRFALRAGLSRLEGTVRFSNDRGVALYLGAGFQIEGVRRQAARIDGVYSDELYLGKLLAGGASEWKPPRLETPRLSLRPLEPSDAPAIFAYASDPEVARYTLWEAHRSPADSERYIEQYVLPNYRRGIPDSWGIGLKDGPVIGTIGFFWASEKDRCLELGFALARSHWGRGLATEAARGAVTWALASLPVERLQARCKRENARSARVLEKAGFEPEGTLRSLLFDRGRYWDITFFSFPRPSRA